MSLANLVVHYTTYEISSSLPLPAACSSPFVWIHTSIDLALDASDNDNDNDNDGVADTLDGHGYVSGMSDFDGLIEHFDWRVSATGKLH